MYKHCSNRLPRVLLCAGVAILLCTFGMYAQRAFAQDKQTFDLSGVNFWEVTLDGFDTEQEQDGTSVTFEVTGQMNKGSEQRLFSFNARASGDNVTLLLETTGMGAPITAVTVVSKSGAQEVIPFGPLERIAIEVANAKQRWCNPFQGCRFEFWRRRNAVEQSFTFAAPVDVTIDGRQFEARKLLFATAELKNDTPEFSRVTMISTTSDPVQVLDVMTHMPPVIHDGLFHDLRGNAGATIKDGVFNVAPFKTSERFHLGIESRAAFAAWNGRAAINLGGNEGENRRGALSVHAELRLEDGTMAPVAFLNAEVVERGSERLLRLGAGFDSDTYRLVAMNGHDVVTDLDGLSTGHVVAEIHSFDCNIVPEFFSNCPIIAFRALPNQSDACAWIIQLGAPHRVQVFDAEGQTSEVTANTFLMFEDHGETDADHRNGGQMVFSRIAIRGTGIATLGLFDQSIAPAHVRHSY